MKLLIFTLQFWLKRSCREDNNNNNNNNSKIIAVAVIVTITVATRSSMF